MTSLGVPNRNKLLIYKLNKMHVGSQAWYNKIYRWTLKAGPVVLESVFLHGTPWSRLSQKRQDLAHETHWKRMETLTVCRRENLQFPEASFQWNAGTQTTKHIWLMIHRYHGTQQQQAAGKQHASSNQRLPHWKNDQILYLKNQRNTKIELFPGARPKNNEIVQLLKVVVMPNLNFFQAHGLPIRLLRADTT